MAIAITSFDGHTLNGASSYTVEMRATTTLTHAITVNVVTRRNAESIFDAMSINPLEYLLTITPKDTATAMAAWKKNVQQWFSPAGSDVTRVLQGTMDDNTAVQMDVVVRERKLVYDHASGGIAIGNIKYEAIVQAPWPFWEAQATTANAGASITNGGNATALPSLALTSAVHKTRRVTTVSGAGAAGGLVSYPVRFTLNDAIAVSANTFVFIEGVSVPTYVTDGGSGTSKVWALVDTASDGSTLTHIDIVYGSGLVNPLGGTLVVGGMNLGSGSISNTQWRWSDFHISRTPSRPGAWRPVAAGNHNSNAQISYGVFNEGASTLTFGIGVAGKYDNSADGMVLVIGSQADSSNAIPANSLNRTLAYDVDAYSVSAASTSAMDQASITSVTVANPTVITTNVNHNLSAGDQVTITGSTGITPSLNGTYLVLSTPAPTLHTFSIAVNVTVASGVAGLVTRVGTNSNPNPTIIHTTGNHALLPGDQVAISGNIGYTPDLNNTYTVLANPAPAARTFAISDTVTVLGGTGGTATKVHTAQAYVRYRLPNTIAWLDAWTSNVAGATSAAIDVPGAVEIIIGVENNGSTPDPCTLVITSGSEWILNLDATTVPTLAVNAATNMDYYDGVYQIGAGASLSFNKCLVPDGTTTIDCKARTITVTGDGPLYAGSSNYPIVFSTAPYWCEAFPGAQTISNATGGTVAATIRATYEAV